MTTDEKPCCKICGRTPAACVNVALNWSAPPIMEPRCVEHAQALCEQPLPQPNQRRPVWDLVIEDMKARDTTGRQRYGTPLQAFNGRDALVDAYQEALDLCAYLRQAIEERSTPTPPPAESAAPERKRLPQPGEIPPINITMGLSSEDHVRKMRGGGDDEASPAPVAGAGGEGDRATAARIIVGPGPLNDEYRDLIAAALAAARREGMESERERCMKAVCRGCYEDVPCEQRGEWKHWYHRRGQRDLMPCRAAAIRSATPGETT